MRKVFNEYQRQMLRWTVEFIPAEPHQELLPWVNLFRPVQHRHLAWEIAWPEIDEYHP